MCAAYGPDMDTHHRPHDQTPDEQRTARDKRWAKVTSMHWHTYRPMVETQARADDEDLVRGTKPIRIPSRSPHDQAG